VHALFIPTVGGMRSGGITVCIFWYRPFSCSSIVCSRGQATRRTLPPGPERPFAEGG
jgi:hypothetical protein